MSELGALPAYDGLGARRTGGGWVSYQRSSRMTLTACTSLNSRMACIFDITVRSWNQLGLEPLTFINVRLASCMALFACSCVDPRSRGSPYFFGWDLSKELLTVRRRGLLNPLDVGAGTSALSFLTPCPRQFRPGFCNNGAQTAGPNKPHN